MKLLIKFIIGFIFCCSMSSCISNYLISKDKQSVYPSIDEYLAISYTIKDTQDENDKNSLVNEFLERPFTINAYNLILEAKSYLGTPYLYGGTTRKGIDCSSFVQQVFEKSNIYLPRTSILQSMEGKIISTEELKKGDLLFFAVPSKKRISHVGIVESITNEGEIFFIHASTSQGVTITSLNNTPYWKKRYQFSKRLIEENNYQENLIQTFNENSNPAEKLSLVKYSF